MRGRLPGVAGLIMVHLLGGTMLSPSRTDAATFRVVDGETGEPLEGAVVVVVWNRPLFHGSVAPYHVVEQVTAADGTFSGTVWPGLPLPLERRDVVVYKPGYRPRIEHTDDRWAPLFGQADVGLTKVVSVQEAQGYEHASDVGVEVCMGEPDLRCVRPEQVPHLMRLMAIHQKIFNPPPAGVRAPGEGPR